MDELVAVVGRERDHVPAAVRRAVPVQHEVTNAVPIEIGDEREQMGPIARTLAHLSWKEVTRVQVSSGVLSVIQ